MSDTTKILSWAVGAILAYVRMLQEGIIYFVVVAWYFLWLQILAFKLNLRAVEEKEL